MKFADLIPQDDWDFFECPPDALQTCLIYEYTRQEEELVEYVSVHWDVCRRVVPKQFSERPDELRHCPIGIIWQNEEWILWVPENFATAPFLKLLREGTTRLASKMPLDDSILEPGAKNRPIVERLESHQLHAVWSTAFTWFFAVDGTAPTPAIEARFSEELRKAKDSLSAGLGSHLYSTLTSSGHHSSKPVMRDMLNRLGAVRLWNALKANGITSIAKAAEQYMMERGRIPYFKGKDGWSDARRQLADYLEADRGPTHLRIRPVRPPPESNT